MSGSVIPEEWARDWIMRYQPREISSALWHDGGIGRFVRAALLDIAGEYRSRSDLSSQAIALSRIVTWSVERGMALDWELILDPHNTESWLRSQPHGCSDRKILELHGRRLATATIWPPEHRPESGRGEPLRPYTEDQMGQIRRGIESQVSELHRRAGWALLAFAAGAGIYGSDITRATPDTVSFKEGYVILSAKHPSRRDVPVLAEYEETVHVLAAGVRRREYLVSQSAANHGAKYIATLLGPIVDGDRVDSRRLRNTWIARHLMARTPLSILAQATGVTPIGTLERFVRLMPPPDRASYLSYLRNA